MARDDGRTLTAEEWKAMWGEDDSEEEEENYVLPKMYPGPRIRCPNCGYWQVQYMVRGSIIWSIRDTYDTVHVGQDSRSVGAHGPHT